MAGCSQGEDPGEASRVPEAPPERPKLNVAWSPGEQTGYRLEIHEEIRFGSPRRSEPLEQVVDHSEEWRVEVEEAPDGEGADLHIVSESLQVSLRRGEESETFEAMSSKGLDRADGSRLSRAFGPWVGETVVCRLGTDGRLSEVEGRPAQSVEGDAELPSYLGEMVRARYSIENLGFLLDPVRAPLDPLSVGAEWDGTFEWHYGVLGKFQIRGEWAFSDWETRQGRQCAVIVLEGRVVPSDTDRLYTLQAGEASGRIWLDPLARRAVAVEMHQELELTREFPSPPGGQGGGSRKSEARFAQELQLEALEERD